MFDVGATRQLDMGDIDVLPAADATAVAVASMRLRLLQECLLPVQQRSLVRVLLALYGKVLYQGCTARLCMRADVNL